MGSQLKFSLNDILLIENVEYKVLGMITFRNKSDGCSWDEYMLSSIKGVRWLSIDNTYNEYAIYTQVNYQRNASKVPPGYKLVDSGTASVTRYFGRVDVDPGETVTFEEYEDSSEENIISYEYWGPETEKSEGYYLDPEEIQFVKKSSGRNHSSSLNFKLAGFIFLGVFLAIFSPFFSLSNFSFNITPSISSVLKDDINFTYTTSITSDTVEKEKADVYKTALSIEDAAKYIIDKIEGKTNSVSHSEEDNSVGILTSKEYCLIYQTETEETFVQVNSRVYSYASTNSLYRGRNSSYRFFRSHYYSTAYDNDRDNYSKYSSSYDNYDGGKMVVDTNDPLNVYSNSVRQSSVNVRSSSGGSSSFGK